MHVLTGPRGKMSKMSDSQAFRRNLRGRGAEASAREDSQLQSYIKIPWFLTDSCAAVFPTSARLSFKVGNFGTCEACDEWVNE